MNIFHTIGLLLTLAALASYVNHKFLKLPTTIGLMSIALGFSIILVALGHLGVWKIRESADFVSSINFSDILLHGMLAFLLFAGSLHVDLNSLRSAMVPVFVFSTIGLVIATFLTGGLFWLATGWLGISIPFLHALLFGALVSPTDPIAVLGILKKAGAPQSLEILISGESLFNDGVAVVVFLTILSMATGGSTPDLGGSALFLVKEALGGALLGLAIGWVAYLLLRSVDAYPVEVLLTLSVASGGYALAEVIHVSAPIAMVAAGLLIGNHGRAFAMSETTREHLDAFWELIDEILNALLFLLIGMEMVILNLEGSYLLAGVLSIGCVLLARYLSVLGPLQVMRLFRPFQKGLVSVLTWGGLRGGISIALALSLTGIQGREVILTATYIVVIFSVLVQGLTFGSVVRATTTHRGRIS